MKREIADVEVPDADVHHRSQGAGAYVDGCSARFELGGERGGGNRKEPAQLLERARVRAPVIKDPKHSRQMVKATASRFLDESRDGYAVEVTDDLREIEVGVEVVIREETDLLRGIS